MDLTFGTPLSQTGYLLQLTTLLGANGLQALRARGVVTMGLPASLALFCDDGSQASRHCLVECVGYLGSDGGLRREDRLTSNLKRLIALNPPRTATRSPTATAPQWSS